MGLLSKIFSNTRKPQGFFGRLMVAGMNGGSHASMATWGLEKTGVDYSPVSVAKSSKVNAETIAKGRCEVKEANVAALPFVDGQLALATAFATVYFWPDIEKSFSEVGRVLVDGGTFLIVNEDDGLSGNNEKWEKMIEGMHTYTPDELKTHLTAAGFRNVTIHRDEDRHWLAVTAMK